MRHICTVAACAVFAGAGFLLLPAAASAEPLAMTSETLTLNAEQVDAGRDVAGQECSECHGVTLRGALGPALRDEVFMSSWEGRTVQALHDFTIENMPPSAPGSLAEDEYLAIMAFILSNNGFEAADDGVELTLEELEGITIE